MPISLSNYRTGAPSFKFEKAGDKLAGLITRVREPFEQTDKFSGRTEVVMVVEVETGDGTTFAIWPRFNPPSDMGRKVADATEPHGGIAEGGFLSVEYSSDKQLEGRPQAMKVYSVEYSPPEPEPVEPGEEPF